jgi:hypothetical protein
MSKGNHKIALINCYDKALNQWNIGETDVGVF